MIPISFIPSSGLDAVKQNALQTLKESGLVYEIASQNPSHTWHAFPLKKEQCFTDEEAIQFCVPQLVVARRLHENLYFKIDCTTLLRPSVGGNTIALCDGATGEPLSPYLIDREKERISFLAKRSVGEVTIMPDGSFFIRNFVLSHWHLKTNLKRMYPPTVSLQIKSLPQRMKKEQLKLLPPGFEQFRKPLLYSYKDDKGNFRAYMKEPEEKIAA